MDTQQTNHDYHLLVDAELKQKIYDLQEFGDWSFKTGCLSLQSASIAG